MNLLYILYKSSKILLANIPENIPWTYMQFSNERMLIFVHDFSSMDLLDLVRISKGKLDLISLSMFTYTLCILERVYL
jgi:hypothetical protein